MTGFHVPSPENSVQTDTCAVSNVQFLPLSEHVQKVAGILPLSES